MRMPSRRQKLDVPSLIDRGAASGGAARPRNPYSIEVLRRAIDILAEFTDSRPSMSLAEIVDVVRLPKTTVFRVLSSLVEWNYCEWDAQAGKYSLGFRYDVAGKTKE